MEKQELILGRCIKCKALQIKIIRHPYENCSYCNSKLEKVKFKEVKNDKTIS